MQPLDANRISPETGFIFTRHPMRNLFNYINRISAVLRPGAQWAARNWRHNSARLLCALAGPIARRRSPWRLVSQWPAAIPPLRGKLALFAHDDSQGEVRDYVFDLLSAWDKAGFQIVFVSNAGHLLPAALARLQTLCSAILIRRDLGGQWGAWREALHAIDTSAVTQLQLTTSDHYGPFGELGAFFDRDDGAIWAMTDSWHLCWHLQPGLLLVPGAVMRHPAWQDFWSHLPATNLRALLLRDGDVAFSQTLLRAGFELRAAYRFLDLCATVDLTLLDQTESPSSHTALRQAHIRRIENLIRRRVPFDPTQLLWRQLLRAGAPLLSRRLIRDNPDGARDLFDCAAELAALQQSPSVIERDLIVHHRQPRLRKTLIGFAGDMVLGLRATARRARDLTALALSVTRSPLQNSQIWPDHAVEIGRRVVVFVHFDGAGEVKPHVLCYLRALRETGVSIVFVSNAGRLKPAALELLKPLCAAVIVRRNIGYDFGAWREGLAFLRGSLEAIDWLALANDSVYAPVVPLAPLLARFDFTKADVWGFTSSDQRSEHLQSYFLAVSPRVMRSTAWRDFWAGVRPVNSKSWAISNGELRFSEAMGEAGFKLKALFPHGQAIDALEPVEPGKLGTLNQSHSYADYLLFDWLGLTRRRILTGALLEKRTLNPTADLWRELLRMDFPFIKRELLRLNPSQVADAIDWRGEIEPRNPELAAVIEADLRRSVRGRIM